MKEELQSAYEDIANLIHSESSPVGIDAKKTHIMILMKLDQIQADLLQINERLKRLES